jgi:hypothetical protein
MAVNTGCVEPQEANALLPALGRERRETQMERYVMMRSD